MPIDAKSRVTRADDVLLTRAGDQGVLVDEARGAVHVVNETAARIWELCGKGPTLEELIQAMTDEYDVAATELRPDIEDVLESFTQLELVSISAES
jgi:PqqD family protein of HPr-rel-A system